MRIAARAPIIYATATDELVHCPMVEVSVDGIVTRMILDTGATDHLITVDLAGLIGVPLAESTPGTDTTGAQVRSWTAGPMTLLLGGAAVALDMLAIDGPPPFSPWGIGGILSPQSLSAEVAVLDLIADSLWTTDADIGEVAESLRSRYDDRGLVRVGVGRHKSGLLTVPVAMTGPSGNVVGVALVDSGAATTEFDGRRLATSFAPGAPSVGAGVSGTAVTSTRFDVASLTVGGINTGLDLAYIRAELPAPEGFDAESAPVALLGMDVMAGTVLIIGSESACWLRPSVAIQ